MNLDNVQRELNNTIVECINNSITNSDIPFILREQLKEILINDNYIISNKSFVDIYACSENESIAIEIDRAARTRTIERLYNIRSNVKILVTPSIYTFHRQAHEKYNGIICLPIINYKNRDRHYLEHYYDPKNFITVDTEDFD